MPNAAPPFDDEDIERFRLALQHHWNNEDASAWLVEACVDGGIDPFYGRIISEEPLAIRLAVNSVYEKPGSLVDSRPWLAEDDPLWDSADEMGANSELSDLPGVAGDEERD